MNFYDSGGDSKTKFFNNFYGTIEGGVGLVSERTENLGTNGQFIGKATIGVMVLNCIEISGGYTHISNGKVVFHWPGVNRGENFPNIQLSVRF